jgi:hypothetical protein
MMSVFRNKHRIDQDKIQITEESNNTLMSSTTKAESLGCGENRSHLPECGLAYSRRPIDLNYLTSREASGASTRDSGSLAV